MAKLDLSASSQFDENCSNVSITRSSDNKSFATIVERSVIIHRDENGFGLRIKGYGPAWVEHVHENGAAWRAGVRTMDRIHKVNGIDARQLNHQDIVRMFMDCNRFVGITLMSPSLSSSSSTSNSSQDEEQLASMRGNVAYKQQVSGSNSGGGRLLSPIGQKLHRLHLSNASSKSAQYLSARAAGIGAIAQDPTCGALTPEPYRGRQQQQQQTFEAAAAARRSESMILSASDARSRGVRPAGVCINCRTPSQAQLPSMSAGGSHEYICTPCQLRFGTTQQATRGNDMGGGGDNGLMMSSMHQQQALLSRIEIKVSDEDKRRQHSQLRLPIVRSNTINQAISTSSLPSGRSPRLHRSGREHRASQSPSVVRPVTTIKRLEVIRELIDTERTHTERLRCLDELFYRPLKTNNLMTSDQLRMVFSCHRTLYKIHRQIYRTLMSANHNQLMYAGAHVSMAEPLLGSALLEIFEGDLKKRLERAACAFCACQSTNVELLNKLTRPATKVGEFLAQVTSQQMVGRLGIKDLLAACFQRLTKYPLLLEGLLKSTPRTVSFERPKPSVAEQRPAAVRAAHRSQLARRASERLGLPMNNTSSSSSSLLRPVHQVDEYDDEEEDDDDENDAFDDNDIGAFADALDDMDGDRAQRQRATIDDEFKSQRLRGRRLTRRRASNESNNAHFRKANADVCIDDELAVDDASSSYDSASGADETDEDERNARRMIDISLAEEREFIERALVQSRQILVKVNEAIHGALSRQRLRDIWKRTDKYPGVPVVDVSKQQVIHEGLLTLRLSKRSFEVYVLLLNDYLIILTREGGNDKYRLKFFPADGRSNAASASNSSSPYSPVFVIDEHLATRDAATDENGFYLLCKRKDDSRMYEFAARSPAERLKWRDLIQSTIDKSISRKNRRPSCVSTITKSSSDISANRLDSSSIGSENQIPAAGSHTSQMSSLSANGSANSQQQQTPAQPATGEPVRVVAKKTPDNANDQADDNNKFVGTISYVEDDGIVMPSKMAASRVLVDQAVQVRHLNESTHNTIAIK